MSVTTATTAHRRGAESAYGRRRPVETEVRKAVYRALRLAGSRYQRAFPDYLEFIPAVRSAEEFADLSARAACYLGDAGLPAVPPRSSVRCSTPALVPHMDPDLVRDPGWVSHRPVGRGPARRPQGDRGDRQPRRDQPHPGVDRGPAPIQSCGGTVLRLAQRDDLADLRARPRTLSLACEPALRARAPRSCLPPVRRRRSSNPTDHGGHSHHMQLRGA